MNPRTAAPPSSEPTALSTVGHADVKLMVQNLLSSRVRVDEPCPQKASQPAVGLRVGEHTHASARVRADPADNQNAEHKLNNGAKGTILTSRTLSTRPCHLGRPVTNSTPRREKKEN